MKSSYNIFYYLLAGILCLTLSCKDEQANIDITPGDNKIELSGIIPFSDGDIYTNLYLKALVAADTSV
ncbi:MAG: hypothetical protein LIO65_06540, partial [Odoribacter sp.]|nr:hypothetical protein [Odoribacter sp.]